MNTIIAHKLQVILLLSLRRAWIPCASTSYMAWTLAYAPNLHHCGLYFRCPEVTSRVTQSAHTRIAMMWNTCNVYSTR